MNHSPDITFMAEYIKNVLYFATVKRGKVLKNTSSKHYFCIDDELVYDNFYSDFGPLNLGCVYRYCMCLKEKIKNHVNKQIIVHYTSSDPEKKSNSAFLMGCYGVLYLSLTPWDAFKPLLIHGQHYRPFQDVTQGDSLYTISILDCLQAIKKARDLGFFNFQDFNYDEYERLDKIQGGDMNWIVPGKFLAFIGPVDYQISLFHPPEMYIDYFLENGVKLVIRLNKKMYDGSVFSNVGITHYDLIFPDGSRPPRHVMLKFLQLSEDPESGAIAVHCKAGLGRTGSLIGCYLIKHYKMTSHEAIGWMRICRPGSVIGHQQSWLEQLEPWLTKQGNMYRKYQYQDVERLPTHQFGIYSIAEKYQKPQNIAFHDSPSPTPPLMRQNIRLNNGKAEIRPQNSRIKEVINKAAEKERDWRMKFKNSSGSNSAKLSFTGEPCDTLSSNNSQRSCGAGDPKDICLSRPSRSLVKRTEAIKQPSNYNQINAIDSRNVTSCCHSTQSNQTSMFKNNDATTYTIQSGNKKISHPIPQHIIEPKYSNISNIYDVQKTVTQRRMLGRSPTPSPTPSPTSRAQVLECSRATNTLSSIDKAQSFKETKNYVSQVKPARKWEPLDGECLSATPGKSPPRPTPRVRSDNRYMATQGDILNSIKFQKRFRNDMATQNISGTIKKGETPPMRSPVRRPSSPCRQSVLNKIN